MKDFISVIKGCTSEQLKILRNQYAQNIEKMMPHMISRNEYVRTDEGQEDFNILRGYCGNLRIIDTELWRRD